MTILIASIIAAVLTASIDQSFCNPDDKDPPATLPEEQGQHFCCDSVNATTLSGEGCDTIGVTQVDFCPNVLYCAGSYTKSADTDKTTCAKA